MNNKINFIDHIIWINLEISILRKNYMEKLLKNISIKNTRINAINGFSKNILKYIPFSNKYISRVEIACTLSHIKAINYLNKLEGNYFLVLEDDITFDNIMLIPKDLQSIILEAPEFDILILKKTYNKILNNLYTKWNDPTLNSSVYCTAAYVISRNGINNLIKLCKYNEYTDKFDFNINNISVADIFLYKNLNTYIYKYDYINTLNESSYIHLHHIEFHKISSQFQLDIINNDFDIK